MQLTANSWDLNARLRTPERASKQRTIASPQPVKTMIKRIRRTREFVFCGSYQDHVRFESMKQNDGVHDRFVYNRQHQ